VIKDRRWLLEWGRGRCTCFPTVCIDVSACLIIGAETERCQKGVHTGLHSLIRLTTRGGADMGEMRYDCICKIAYGFLHMVQDLTLRLDD
jgi:hypothetical protein